jgi:Ca2+-binding RTX toxin-like protein
MVQLVKHDLEFILKQIEIAEAHAAGSDLAELVAGYNGNDGLTQAHLLPYGLRTVDGSYNNLLPGRENWGAADQSFPGIFTPTYMNDADGDRYNFGSYDLNGDGVPDTPPAWYTNNNYGNAGPASGSSPGPGSGTVIDADPRIISNLIVDQTLNNPAAIAAALTHAGMSGQPLMTALSAIVAAHNAAKALAPVGSAAPTAAYTAAEAALNAKLAQYGIEMDGNTVYLPNVSPDDGLSSPFNGWMTIFGQFFDHGLDFVAKGGNGTVYVPLSPNDPLYVPGGQNYIPLTRVTVNAGPDKVLGTADDGPGPKNLTTPWVDQNQTYASSASKQVFMREYIAGPDGKPIASGLMLEGSNGGLATWAEIKAQAKNVLGIELTDLNVGNIPLIAADEYGNFIPGANGYPQLVVGMGPDGQLGTADDELREGNPSAPVSAQGVVLTGHAFLDDIAHAAVPIVAGGVLQADTDSALGYANADGSPGPQGSRGPTAYDNELLDRHFIAGDGRVNENIALTAVHQVFHSEHNRIVEMTKQIALESGDLAFLNEWLLVDVTAVPTDPIAIAALVWDGERLFQAGRFTNEMEYQHLVFEEFGRMMQPDIDAFVFEPSADINPSIAAEFAHVVYRFGHSMLRQDIAVIELDENGNPVQNDISLFDGFLNPVMYDSLGDAEAASGAIIRGMSRQTGSEIDEFVTDVLRNQLLGIPLDLATINLARGRDVGMPSLNAAREKFFAETGDTLLKPYTSWADFALNLKNPASIINFIAAYGTHASVLNTSANPRTVEQLREAATKLVLGDNTLSGSAKIAFDNDRLDFLNATGAYANDVKLGGLNTIDFWMGGLAEKKMSFGGMLGSTFSFVFQMTMENLQDADRFYYLSRTQGLNLLNELENNTFAELVMRNTDLGGSESTALPGNLFSAFDMPTLEMDISKQLGADPVSDDPFLGGFSKLIERVDANGDGVAEYIRINSNEHFTVGGTEGNDIIVSGGGDDAIWGKGGNDRIEAGYGVDEVFGGQGDDIITNSGTDIGEADFLHGNEGNDVIHGGSGLSLLFGNQGKDFIITGPDGKEAFGGTGDDFILGGTGGDFLLGNEGNDWIEGGQRFDTLAGENSELFFNSSIIGHDVLNGGSGDTDYDGESGDDIMFQNSEGIQRSNGMAGFDWAIHKGDSQAANSELGIPIFATQEAFILRDRFDLVEGLSGWNKNDTLTGRSKAVNSRPEIEGTAAIFGPDSLLDSYSNDLLAKNVGLINGLNVLVAHLGSGIPVTKVVNGQTVPVLDANGVQERVILSSADASDILLGGGGSDVIKGLAGNDIIDGDKWLNVRIAGISKAGTSFSVDMMEGDVTLYRNAAGVFVAAPGSGTVAVTKPLSAWMVDGAINPGQLSIVREIISGNVTGDVDTAVYTDIRANYSFGTNSDGSIFVDHTGFVQPEQDDDLPEEEGVPTTLSDGRDAIRNVEKLDFTDFDLNVIEGTGDGETLNGTAQDDLIVGKGGSDALYGFAGDDILIGGANGTGGSGSFEDNFNTSALNNSTGATAWTSAWVETGDNGNTNSPSLGQIRIDSGNPSNALVFRDDDNDTGNGTATIQRTVNLAGATTAMLSYDYQETSFDSGETVTVTFAADGVNFNQTIQVINGNSGSGETSVALTGPFTANAAIRFVVSGTNNNSTSDIVSIDNLAISFSSVETLNGGLGNDTYIFDLGDGNDTINEAVNSTSGGDADRIVIRSTTIDPETLLPVLTGLNAFDSNTGTASGDLVINYAMPSGSNQTITVAGHFTGNNAQTGVERINFSDATYEGYELGADDYLISRLDQNNRDIDLSDSGDNNFIVGEQGNADEITGGTGNDLIFGGTGDNELSGGDGDDLLVGGSSAGDDDLLDGGTGADTMVGGGGNDTYVVDDADDVIVEAAGSGLDAVETDRAAYTLSANVEDLTYTGAAAFTGTGNDLGNRIEGGAGVDTLTGLGGDDTYVVTAGDVIVEVVGGGTDTVSSATTYTLGTNIENLTLTGGDPVNGTGNAEANVIIGNDDNNQLFGGAGNDTLTGNDGNDLLDGGEGNDTLNGGDDTDTIIGGSGNDTIDVGGGVNRIVYNTVGFGNDIINSFDAAGGTPASQDRIDLSGLGVTAANFAQRVFESASGGNTIITIRENGVASAIQGTIQINGVTNANIDATDFTLAAAPPPAFGAPTAGANTITGNANANLINGLGGNDALSGVGGDDVINGDEGADTLNGGDGNDTLSGGVGAASATMVDNFGTVSYANNNGSFAFSDNWDETGDNDQANNGDILITGGRLTFAAGADNNDTIQRSINLTGATAATLSFAYQAVALDADETVIVQAFNGSTWDTLGTLGGTTTSNFSAPLNLAHSAIRFVATGGFEAGETFHIDNLTVNITGNLGVDTVNGDAGDDTIIWNANALAAATDGRDIVNGGEEGVLGDTFVVNGNASAETYRIYTRAEFLAVNAGAALDTGTEIVVTRNGTGVGSIIAELSEIEEIRINAIDPVGGTTTIGGDTFEVIGDFSTTSLRLNTITIDGDEGDDTIDISALTSAHRIVFKSNGGNDTIIGALQAEDVIELPEGEDLSAYNLVDNQNGTKTISNGTHSVTFSGVVPPQFQTDEPGEDDEEEDNETPSKDDDDEEEAAADGVVRTGTAQSDTLVGATGDDNIVAFAGDDIAIGNAGADTMLLGDDADFASGGAGADMIFAGAGDDHVFAGADNDIVYGDAGADRIFGDQGNDMITAGAGNDTVFGGAGNDLIVAEVGDGNDVYFGDEGTGGTGIDTLDMSAASAAITVNLGSGPLMNGTASSSQTGSDTIWGLENVNTGSGDDIITASNAVNVINGGAGNDTFKFLTTAAADGDTIHGFEPGDRIDLSGIDANTGIATDQSFQLVSGGGQATAGQLAISFADGNTIVEGHVDGDNAADFRIEIEGQHTLTNSSFNL